MSSGFFARTRQLDYKAHLDVQQANTGEKPEKGEGERRESARAAPPDIKNNIKHSVSGALTGVQIMARIRICRN